MDKTTNRNVILLSIQPRYADAIMSGSKKVEFRRTAINPAVRYVVVYACSPVKRIVGYFEVERAERCSPQALWQRHQRAGGIERDAFFRYFEGCKQGTGIIVRRAWRMRTLAALDEFGLLPPQSFRYVPIACWQRITSRTASVVIS